MDYFSHITDYIYGVFFTEETHNVIFHTQIKQEDIDNLINEVILEIKIEKEIDDLINRYKKLCEEKLETIEEVEEDDDDNRPGPALALLN